MFPSFSFMNVPQTLKEKEKNYILEYSFQTPSLQK